MKKTTIRKLIAGACVLIAASPLVMHWGTEWAPQKTGGSYPVQHEFGSGRVEGAPQENGAGNTFLSRSPSCWRDESPKKIVADYGDGMGRIFGFLGWRSAERYLDFHSNSIRYDWVCEVVNCTSKYEADRLLDWPLRRIKNCCRVESRQKPTEGIEVRFYVARDQIESLRSILAETKKL